MDWRIDNIKISNFKFFKDDFTLKAECKNILLYGENGSGKSSIYWSFYTIFQACLKDALQASKYFDPSHPQNLRNKYSLKGDYSGLEVRFRKDGVTLSFEDSSSRVCVQDAMHPDFMRLTMAASDFMNYKFLASLFDFSNSQQNDVFPVLAKEVFPFIVFRNSFVAQDGTDSRRNDADYWWKELSSGYKSLPKRNDQEHGAYLRSKDEYIYYQNALNQFNLQLRRELGIIFAEANKKLSSLFNESIELMFDYEDAKFDELIPGTVKSHDGKLHDPRVILKAVMTEPGVVDKSTIEHPRSFFNEARLTCMALALRLAFLDARNISGADFAPVLFVDDLLISLDMGCRRSVIQILLSYTAKKQMFIMTHDRAFYNMVWAEIAKIDAKSEWKRFELYSDDRSGIKYPVLIEKETPIENARRRYAAFDFSGCANTLRSLCESELKRILPLNFVLRKQKDPDSEIHLNPLANLIGNLSPFRKRFFTNELEQFPDIAPNLSQHRQLIMNPYSHDDTETPLYRSELKTAISEVEALTKVNKRQLLSDDTEVSQKVFVMRVSNGTSTVSAEFCFIERFECVSYLGKKYYGDSSIVVLSCSETSIKTGGGITVRQLFKDIYEFLGLTASTRPLFDDCIFVKLTGEVLSSL